MLYNLRVTVNGSIYVDIPVTLINFLSIDPPPMPGDGARLMNMQPAQVKVSPVNFAQPTHNSARAFDHPQTAIHAPYHHTSYDHMAPIRERQSESVDFGDTAKASSTTLNLDSLIEGQPPSASRADGGSGDMRLSSNDHSSGDLYPGSSEHTDRAQRMDTITSVRSGWTGESMLTSATGHDQDEQFAAARQAIGRQRSLAVVNRTDADRESEDGDDDGTRARERIEEESEDASHENATVEGPRDLESDDVAMGNDAPAYKPDSTPAEVAMPIMESGSAGSSIRGHIPTLGTPVTSPRQADPEREYLVPAHGVGDDTMFQEHGLPNLSGEYGGFDYDEEEEGEEWLPRHELLPSATGVDASADAFQDVDESVDITLRGHHTSNMERPSASGLGDQTADLSLRSEGPLSESTSTPLRTLPTASGLSIMIPKSPSHLSSVSAAAETREPVSERLKRLSASNLATLNTSHSPTSQKPSSPLKTIQKKSSFSFATPGSPLKVKLIPKTSPGLGDSHSPRRPSAALSIKARSPSSKVLSKSQFGSIGRSGPARGQSPTVSAESDYGPPPGLSASDSASSEGHEVESPPSPSYHGYGGSQSPSTTARYSQVPEPGPFEYDTKSPSWSPSSRLPVMSYLDTDPHVSHEQRSGPHSEDDHSVTSHETTTSVLPGVQSRIARLESRQEALRRFSVMAATSGNTAPTPPRAAVHNTSPNTTPTRKSYTTALAREGRERKPSWATATSTDDIKRDTVGESAYIRAKVHPDSVMDFDNMELDPFRIGTKRNSLISSPTSAKSMEATGFHPKVTSTGSPKGSLGSIASTRSGKGFKDTLRVPAVIPAGDPDSSDDLR